MLTRYLFPHRYKRLGLILAAVALVLGLLEMYDVVQLPHLLAWLPSPIGNAELPDVLNGEKVRANHDLYAVLLICGGLLSACSREKQEDEYIGRIRLESLLWAMYAYYALLLLAFLLVSGMPFFTVMMYAMFTPLLLFLARFHLVLLRSAQAALHEE
ncbi:hypothetical protein [Hymenobacter cellulosilyticus]|uniref:Uncharacterized protein n=1 Tax=Hymenobacter cellulosilyticus TaxID=2932248 RepID=A0A8T9QAD0_9BACT|nr:hypothetical protein [Hymenobacter cellulosilyticus]UOQ72770.1 hypothetical protein MUN79_01900 [Hymenobacter cellulosilyticus]